MRKLLNNPIFVGVLVIVAIAGSIFSLKPEYGKSSGPRSLEATEVEEEEEYDDFPSGDTSDTSALDALARIASDRNAFSLFSSKEESAAKSEENVVEERISVIATWIQPDDRLAALDDLIVHEGQSIRKAILQKVESAGVWLKHEEQVKFIPVGESFAYRYTIE